MCDFLKVHPVGYPILVAGALPYTVVPERSGAVACRGLGPFARLELEKVVAGFLR